MKAIRSEDAVSELVASLDLRPIRSFFAREYGGHRELNNVSVLIIEDLYRQFLYLSYAYPRKKIVLPRPVDWFWHCHILDTRKYHEDCAVIFGEILHHHPYFGVCDEEDAAEYAECLADTADIFVQTFGENPHKLFLSAAVCGGSRISSGLNYRLPIVESALN